MSFMFCGATVFTFIFYTLLPLLLSHPDTFNITLSYDLKYALVDYPTNWWNARYFCYELFQQDLASIHNVEDNNEAFSVCPSKNCWMGGTNLFLWNNYSQWIDGTPYNYNPNPINYTATNNEIFGCIRYDNSSFWGKTDCLSLQYIQLPFICNQNDTLSPTNAPSRSPSQNPTLAPTANPTNPTLSPTFSPSNAPTSSPTLPTSSPTNAPTQPPSAAPSISPTLTPTNAPTAPPTKSPTLNPTYSPSDAPSYSPSNAPSNNPSISPSIAPTTPPSAAPSNSPTSPPSVAPSYSPTIAPSISPTSSPLFTPCILDYNLDLIFVVDTSCGITEQQCRNQQTFISSLIQKSKSSIFPRLGYIEFDDIVDETILLNDSRYNINSTLLSDNLNQLIIDTEDADCTYSTPTNTSTEIAIIAAIQQFEDYSNPLGHDKKIILISNCPATDNPCDTTQDLYDNNVDLIIVNVGNQITNDTYLCLSENDPKRMFYAPNFNHSLTTNLTEAIQREICEAPTPSPSAAPTLSPSLSPSQNPTSQTLSPSFSPSISPSLTPSFSPSIAPTSPPSLSPSFSPSIAPSLTPSFSPSISPSIAPSLAPSITPTQPPSVAPSYSPSTNPSLSPTLAPSLSPTGQTAGPSAAPSFSPSTNPSMAPTTPPSNNPSMAPSQPPTFSPSQSPSNNPSYSPSTNPSTAPTTPPTNSPSGSPSQPPTFSPSQSPSNNPSMAPTIPPSNAPTMSPTPPTLSPSNAPTQPPSNAPTSSPTLPTNAPTPSPTTHENECYGSDYIFCYFMDISLKQYVTEDIITSVTNAAAGDNAVSFTQNILNVPVSDIEDITYIIQWRPIDYPCYNPEIDVTFKPIGHNIASAAIQVWKLNENYDIGNNLTSKTMQIGTCLGDGTDCNNYDNCVLTENLKIPIIDTNQYYGINLTEPAEANGICTIDGGTISIDVEVTLFCDLQPTEPDKSPNFVDSIIESIQCNNSITYRSNANGATTNYYNVILGSYQSNITFHLCISEENTSLSINEWNGQNYNEKYIESPMFDNISSFEIFDELTTICDGGYYAQIIDEYVLASTDYYYVGVIVNGVVLDNPYEYTLLLECNSYTPTDIDAEQEPRDCKLYELEFILLPLFVFCILLSVVILIWELIFYCNTTHKLFNLDIETEATFFSIFNKATGFNKFLYILDFLTLFGCLFVGIAFFIFFIDDLKGSKFLNVEIYIIGGIGSIIAALFGFILLYIKWNKFLSLYFAVMNNENRINYQKQIIMFDLFIAALQDGIICSILLIIMSEICTNKLWLHWLFTTIFIIYFIWLNWKVLRTLYVCKSSKNYQHEKKQSMLAKANDNDDIITEFELKPQPNYTQKTESFEPRNVIQAYKPNVDKPNIDKPIIEMQRVEPDEPDLDLSLTVDNPDIEEEKFNDKLEEEEEEREYPLNTNAGFGEGDDDLMLPDEHGNGYKFAQYTDNYFVGDKEEKKQQQQQQQETPRWTNISNTRQRVVHPYYIKVCDKLMDRYELIAHNIDERQCELASSGINAISCIFHGIFVEYKFNGDLNIIISNDLYSDTLILINYLKINYCSMNLNIFIIEDITNSVEITKLFQNDAIRDANNILFIESCTNPHGNIFDFELISTLKSVSSTSYIIIDNTLLTSAIFNPFEFGADIVVISLSKYYSGGTCIGGAILCNSQNMKLMNIITDWIIINGIHCSPFHCKLILQNIDLLNKRIENMSVITNNIVFYLRDLINKDIFKNQLLTINHPFLLNHISHSLCKKYFGDLGPTIIAIKISLKNHNNIQKWLSSSNKIKKQMYCLGKKETKFDVSLQTVNDGTWCKLSIGWNLNIDDIKQELLSMFQKLSSYPN